MLKKRGGKYRGQPKAPIVYFIEERFPSGYINESLTFSRYVCILLKYFLAGIAQRRISVFVTLLIPKP